MQVMREASIVNIKNKMTDIRRNRKTMIYHNYFNNCDYDEEIFVVYGENTVVFWDDDHGVVRGYFYSSDIDEMIKMLHMFPQGCIVDYVTKNKGKMQAILENGGLKLLHEMHRMSAAGLTNEERKNLDENQALMMEALYRPQNARCAGLDELEALYQKLNEVFDARESHLPTREDLVKFIQNQWVAVYYEGEDLLGFHMFTVEKGSFYGYQIWNGGGPEVYFTLVQTTNNLYGKYLHENNIVTDKIKPGYSWINIKNRKSMRLAQFWGQKFDGLYDFVYEKV